MQLLLDLGAAEPLGLEVLEDLLKRACSPGVAEAIAASAVYRYLKAASLITARIIDELLAQARPPLVPFR